MKSKIVAALAVMMILLSATVVLSPQASASDEGTSTSEEGSHEVAPTADVVLGFAAFAVLLMIVMLGVFTHFWGKRK